MGRERVRQQQEIENARGKHLQELERIAGLTSAEAKDQLVAVVEADARQMAAGGSMKSNKKFTKRPTDDPGRSSPRPFNGSQPTTLPNRLSPLSRYRATT